MAEKPPVMSEVRRIFSANPHQIVPPHLQDLVKFLGEFNAESQRGAALLAASMLDTQLKAMLEAFLLKGVHAGKLVGRAANSFNAPLGTLSARMEACAAMGLLSPSEYAEINLVRQVRNQFGHGLGVTFETDKVKRLCDKLTMSVGNIAKAGVPPADARARFVTAAVSIIVLLTNRAHYVSKHRLAYREWEF